LGFGGVGICGGVGCGGVSVANVRLGALRDAVHSTRVVLMWFMVILGSWASLVFLSMLLPDIREAA
jgi:hypothetical protein